MFSEKDLAQIRTQGIDVATIGQQIEHFRQGFPYLPLAKAATVGDGIVRLTDEQAEQYAQNYDAAAGTLRPLKFVPASGAATRMFKALFSFLENGKRDASVEQFFERLSHFAFYDDLKTALAADGHDIRSADPQVIADYFLNENGLGYGQLPKGLLKFHQYPADAARTPVEEHLVEAARYASTGSSAKLHFTVSPEHRSRFEALVGAAAPRYGAEFGISYHVDFSEQQPATDTIAVNPDNTPFREKDGTLLFRPAGHGALLENLNALDADVVFIKNIDNVVPDRLKDTTVLYKKALAGVLLDLRNKLFEYQTKLAERTLTDEGLLDELADFFEKTLYVRPPEDFSRLSDEAQTTYFQQKLDRPLRVCGMVKNVGEPGGGPFWVENADGTRSLQIVESAQVEMDNADQKALFNAATHF
ncbi:MAG: DUF4301 family protein, partial [Cytophagaceae bacterium]|nr:DUF4301 family protein [Cytophagaceae bacterium]